MVSMFLDSVVAGKINLSPTKFGYIVTEALGPYFYEMTIEEAKGEFYTPGFD